MSIHSYFVRIFFLLFLLNSFPVGAFASDCADAVDTVQIESWQDFPLHPKDFLPSDTNIFTESLPSTLASGLIWLSAVQLARTTGEAENFITPAFRITVPVDMALTAISHAVALSPWLSRLTSGKAFSPRFEFAVRTGANAAIGVGVITSTWMASGIDVSAPHCVAAAALCALVYPTLQWAKNGLYRAWPKKQDLAWNKKLRESSPGEFRLLSEVVQRQARSIGIIDELSENSLFESIDALLLSVPYEDQNLFANWKHPSKKAEKLASDAKRLKQALLRESDPQALEKQIQNLRSARRALIGEILLHSPAAGQALSLGEEFGASASLNIQRTFQDRYAQRKKRVLVASVVDQMLAVGIAGGVFLYGVNHWARTGEFSFR